MFRSHHHIVLLLVCLSSSGQSRPRVAHKGAPDVDFSDSRKVLILEAVKSGILNSLGMERTPRPAQKASEQELRRMHELYREKLREMSGNSSQIMRETRRSTMSTVLFPTAVRSIKMLRRRDYQQSGRHMQWYRAVFHKNPNIKAELTLVRAELKISRQILDVPVQTELQQEVKVRVSGMKRVKSAVWTQLEGNASSTQNVVLDVSSEVEKWLRADDDRSLVVDVGETAEPRSHLEFSLELVFTESKPQKTRTTRSNKEDACDEEGLCCRQSVIVSFKDIGWTDWVVAPTEYTMHFCDGACPHNYKPASMHTQVKSRLHQLSKGGLPHPCCVPAAYEPMVLMHYDSRGKLKLTPFDDMIVSKCYCA
ncbi:protein DVR-1 [Sphaeramia orbicularis]|nr:protein DVR-1-like [Sphaeramia orbicularis]